jgi:hypothetical protein
VGLAGNDHNFLAGQGGRQQACVAGMGRLTEMGGGV